METSQVAVQRIGVIVLGYNRFWETTDCCLASLKEDPHFRSWDVLVVDNGSDSQNQGAFHQAQARYPGIRLLRLEHNAGYPGGMNAGLRAVSGDPIILISSDVLVPSGTISRLATALESNPRAGLAGPVTNAAGNEQRIFVGIGQSLQNVLQRGRFFVDADTHGVVYAYRLDFCCVAMKRKVYETIGSLDETFSPGYYEDFDYSLMARKAGFELLVVENAFVYHESGGTFGGASKGKKTLIARNKHRFLDKHGHDTLLPHVRDGNLAILQQYAEMSKNGSPPPALRIANRLELAHADVPRGVFKRWRYLKKVATLETSLAPYLESPAPRKTNG